MSGKRESTLEGRVTSLPRMAMVLVWIFCANTVKQRDSHPTAAPFSSSSPGILLFPELTAPQHHQVQNTCLVGGTRGWL